MGFFRELRFELEYCWDEFMLKCKHRDRPGEFKYHAWKVRHLLFEHPWYCLKRGVRNLWIWFPLIWRNDCWDHFQLCELMDKQLNEMEAFWKKEAYEESDKAYHGRENEKGWRCQFRRIHKRIKWSRRLMEMWQDEHYTMEWYDKHTKKFPRGSSGLFGEPAKVTLDKWGEPVSYECKPMPEDEREHYSSGADKARLMDEKTFKLWVKSLGYIRHWWH